MEKGVDGHSTGTDGRHTGRRKHNHPFGKGAAQLRKEGGFAGSGLSGKEEVPAGFAKIPEGPQGSFVLVETKHSVVI